MFNLFFFIMGYDIDFNCHSDFFSCYCTHIIHLKEKNVLIIIIIINYIKYNYHYHYLYIYACTFYNLTDAFIQRNSQMRTIEAIKKMKVTWPSMVSWWPMLGICALHLTHPKCTHTHAHAHAHAHTHTHTHTRSSGQPFMVRRPGSSWGFSVLLKGTSVVLLKVERALYIHPPNSCRSETRTHNLSITSPTLDSPIRPRFPLKCYQI